MPTILRAQGLLFDLDGTLVHSIEAVDRAWAAFALRHGLDPAVVLPKIHGRRSIDSIKALLPHVDVAAEDAWIRNREASDTEGVRAVPGALEFLAQLPRERWGIVTSGTSDVATARMRSAGIPTPPVTVFGEDVERGKPEPDPYLLGASRLGIAPDLCVGFEDTRAGILSILAAGMVAVAIGGVEHPHALAHFVGVEVREKAGELVLTLPSAA